MFFRNPYMFSLLLLLPMLILVWRWRRIRFSWVMLLRLLAVACMVLALTDPIIGQEPTRGGPRVILVDQSDSLTVAGQGMVRTLAAQFAQPPATGAEEQEAQQQNVPFWFGANVVAAGNGQSNAADDQRSTSLQETLDPTASDLAQALRTARELLAPTGGEVVLLSDGVQTKGDALYEAQRMADAGIQVDVIPVEPDWNPDVRMVNMSVPPSLRLGEEYAVEINIFHREQPPTAATETPGNETIPATLQLWVQGSTDEGQERLLGEEQVELKAGANSFTFRSETTSSGLLKLRASVRGMPQDTFAANNEAVATTMVTPPPRILLVEGQEGTASEISSALWPAIESDVLPAQQLPTRLSQLQRFDGMVLLDVSAYNLSLDQMATVREFVRSEGRGLVVTGGRNSYSLGAYDDTPLEDILPVSLEPPPRTERSNVAMLLVIDRSASMSIPVDVSKFDMAKEAAILSTEMLQSEDKIGILAFDTRQEWTVPFQAIGEGLTLKQIQDAIVFLDIGGGTDIYAALEEGLLALMQQEASVRHAVLLTDGRSFTNDSEAYDQLVTTARDNDITLSSIAIGLDSDIDLLEQLAQWGNGRYYYADKPEDIPRLTIQESEIARADPVVEGDFRIDIADPHPVIRDTDIAQMPALNGYVGTTRRDNAEVVLVAPGKEADEKDPILATWNYGLGRVVAWTPSMNAPWAENWSEWGDFGSFWTQVIRYTLPEPDSGPLQIQLEPQHGGAKLMVDAYGPGGTPLLADAIARITLPSGVRQEFALHQSAPGRYTQDLLLPTDGAYGVEVLLDRDGEQYYAETGYAHPVPAEYNPYRSYNPAGSGGSDYPQGKPLLERIAEITGGEVLAADMLNIPQAGDEEEAQEQAQQPWYHLSLQMLHYSLWPWLMTVALLLWMLEIAFRRRVR